MQTTKIKNFNKGARQGRLHPIAVKVLLTINQKLKFFARWLQQKTNTYSKGKIKMILILFCCVLTTECAIIVSESFRNSNLTSYQIIPIKSIPLLKKEVLPLAGRGMELNRIIRFKHYLDSLENSNKTGYDSLLSLRPHLLDSIIFLQNLYHEQQTDRK